MGRHAFISYAREDEELTRWLARELTARQVSLWTDAEIVAGSSWSGKIDEAIRASWHFVPVLSRHSLSSPQVDRELKIAFQLRRPLVPVRTAGVEPADLPSELRSVQWSDFSQGTGTDKETVDSFAARLRHDVAVDLSHGQRDWNGLVDAVTDLGIDHKLIEGEFLDSKDLLETTKVLAMALPCGNRPAEMLIEGGVADYLEAWVRRGHGLLLLGYYAANLHHWTKPNILAQRFDGRGFEDDLVLPRGAGLGDAARQAFNYDDHLFLTDIVATPNAHPIMDAVEQLTFISSCSLRLGGETGSLDLYSGQGNSVLNRDPKSKMEKRRDYYPPPFPWGSTPTTERVPVFSAFELTKGRVAMVGTWKLFTTLDRAHNARFLHNVLEWLAEPSS